MNMRIWRCRVLQDEGPPNIYAAVTARHEWQAQLIAFVMDGGIGDKPDAQPTNEVVELAKMYVEAREVAGKGGG